MPSMPRYQKKATKIKDDLIGVSENELDKPTERTKRIQAALVRDNTAWVR